MRTLLLAGLSILQGTPAVLPVRKRPDAVNRMLNERLETLLPALMRETGLDAWLVINRENVEDPVYFTLVPEPVFAARRTTMLLFFDRGAEKGVERITVSRYPIGDLYASAWKGGSDDDQWARLSALLAERDPKRIGVDVSRDWSYGDGLSAGLRDRLREALPAKLRDRLVSADTLAVRWLETRTPLELEVFPQAVAIARGLIADAFSNRVITPGVTTTDDVSWWLRQRYEDLDLATWFHPDVNLQRRGARPDGDASFLGAPGVIQRGDVLHVDMGIRYLRLNTDTQEMGYVLRLGESEPPAGLRRALETGNRWQDLLTAEFKTGRSGNEILASARAAAAKESIACSVYSHPLGFHGHGAGPTIGMWDNQGPTPVRGDWTLRPSTAYAIEGNVSVPVPEWNGQAVQIKLEQSAVFDGERMRYLAGRQTRWHVIE